jgi:cytosine permease
MSTRDERDVKTGGMVGIVLAILVTAGSAILIVAGVYGSTHLAAHAVESKAGMNAFQMIPVVLGEGLAGWLMFALAVAAFPSACFSAFIAANSFKTTLPQVNPFISVGIGAAVSIVLAVTGIAGDAAWVFGIIGASFGPICGAMLVDYLLSGGRWTGPRAGFNPAGWIAWALGFVVGILPNLHVAMPAAPVAAFIVGAAVYFLCAKAGMLSKVVPMPAGR